MNDLGTARRADTKRLIARQIAIANGRNWETLAPSNRNVLLTLAENILATIERKAEDLKW